MSNQNPLTKTSTFPGVNVLLMGSSGTGKTHAIHTLVDSGLEVFCLFLEPGIETLISVYSRQNKPIPPNLHWHYIQPKTAGFTQLKNAAETIGKFDLAGLTRMKDMTRSMNNQMVEVYEILNNFTDQKTGEAYGSVDSWDTKRVLVIDSLSALNRICMDMVIGTKPVKDMADWGIAQNNLMSLLHKLTSGCICHFVLIAHVDRETDQIMGGVKLMVSALGKAITSQIPQPFSDVILATRDGDKFTWDTANSLADVKTRNLPIAAKLPADFGAIISQWQKNVTLAQASLPK